MRRRTALLALVAAAALAAVAGLQLGSKPAAASTAATPCQLGNGVKHVINIVFDNVHFSRDNPNVPSDLELMEQLLAARRAPAAQASLAPVRMLVLDFDGVLTDDAVFVTDAGNEAVRCSRSDGWGIARLREAGVDVVVLSTETNSVVGARCRKLRIACVQACDDKRTALEQLVADRGLTAAEVAYVGNDVNDLACLRWVGVPIAVADARPEVRAAARLVTTRAGGNGAVREVADWILTTRAARDAVGHENTSSVSGEMT